MYKYAVAGLQIQQSGQDRMGLNWLVLFGIFPLTIAGGNNITLEEILEEIVELKYENKMMQTDLNQTRLELTKTQDQLKRTQDVLIPGVGAIIPWIPSKIGDSNENLMNFSIK